MNIESLVQGRMPTAPASQEGEAGVTLAQGSDAVLQPSEKPHL